MRVVFPAPFSPRKPWIFPRPTSIETLPSAFVLPKDLDTLKHIVDKWDDRVISYAKELGETCGSFRIVQRKSHLLLKIEERGVKGFHIAMYRKSSKRIHS